LGYNYSWGNTCIKDHDAFGAQVSKPVALEEYGAQGANTTAVEQRWQAIVLEDTELHMTVSGSPERRCQAASITDSYTVECGTAEGSNIGVGSCPVDGPKAV
jgi:hypothetical protein